jgi:hypothetical protein
MTHFPERYVERRIHLSYMIMQHFFMKKSAQILVFFETKKVFKCCSCFGQQSCLKAILINGTARMFGQQ